MPPTSQRTRGRPRALTPNPQQTTIRSLDRSLAILRILAENEGLSLTELAEASEQAPATVYRILSTLEVHGVVEADAHQLWFIGAEAFRIGSAFLARTNIVERGRPVLRELMVATGETANLAISDDGQVVFVSQVETLDPIRAFFRPGTRSAIHASGIGKAMMAHFAPERVAAIVREHGLPALTENTLSDPENFFRALEEIRLRGWAMDDEEHTVGMRCIAAAIFNEYREPVAGLSVSGPSARVTRERGIALGPLIRSAADRITAAIGGDRPQDEVDCAAMASVDNIPR